MKILVNQVESGKTYKDSTTDQEVLTFEEGGIMKAKYFNFKTNAESIFTVVDNQLKEIDNIEANQNIDIAPFFGQ